MVINFIRRFLAVVLAIVLFPIVWVCVVLTTYVGLTLIFIEDCGLDTGIVRETFLKIVEKWPELYKEIILKVAIKNTHL